MSEKSYPNIYKDEYFKALSQLTAAGAIIKAQDGFGFDFGLKIPLGTLEGTVGYVEPVMKVKIKSKPLLVSHKAIFNYLDDFLKPYTKS